MNPSSLHNDFVKFIQDNRLFTQTDKLLLAFSGGIDSVVLAHLLIQHHFHIELAHCNFKLRGKESDNDEQFAISFAERHHIPIHSQQFETKKIAHEQKITIQEAARQLRYSFFEKLAHNLHFDFILTAHHLDDSIETVFINLQRGTGIKGIGGIPLKNNLIVRPLLFATRDQILTYALQNNLTWREDSSNHSDKYTRNQIRHHLLPLLKSQNKNFYAIFNENIRRFNDSIELLYSLVNDKMQSFTKFDNEQIIIDLKKLKSVPLHTSLLFHFAQNYGFNYDQIKSIFALEHQTGKLFVSSTHKAFINREKLVIVPTKKNYQEKEVYIHADTKQINHPVSLIFDWEDFQRHEAIPNDASIAYLDAAKISFPLVLKKWEPGNRFYPIGMKHSKKISDFLTDIKTARYQKEDVWVLSSNGQICWIVGYRIDDRYKVTDNTEKVFKIKLNT